MQENPDDVYYASLLPYLEPEPNSSLQHTKDLAVCLEALKELRRCAALPYSPCQMLDVRGAVYIWPGSIEQEFLTCLDRGVRESLLVLAAYCRLLVLVDDVWYLKGVGSSLLGAIKQELGDEWAESIRWVSEAPVDRRLQDVLKFPCEVG